MRFNLGCDCLCRSPEPEPEPVIFRELFVAGSVTGSGSFITNPFYDLVNTSDASNILDNQSGYGQIRLCDDQDCIYTAFNTAGSSADIYQPRWRKYDESQTLLWSLTDSSTEIGAYSSAALASSTQNHYDLDRNHNLFYCGSELVPFPLVADVSARLIKIGTNGSTDLTKTVLTAFSGATFTLYRFVSCAVDLDGNIAAVGFRRKYTGTSPSLTVSKEDYIVYYFDSSGTEVWHEDISDGSPNNTDYFRFRAVQCCFDNDGNLYVGFSNESGTKSNLPAVRKYDSSGGVLWTKTRTDLIGSATGAFSVHSLLLTPEEKLVVQYATGVGSILKQYSDASHSTLDWSYVLSSTGFGGDCTCDQEGNLYVSRVNSSGDNWFQVYGTDGTQGVSEVGMSRVFLLSAKPGKHPHFI